MKRRKEMRGGRTERRKRGNEGRKNGRKKRWNR